MHKKHKIICIVFFIFISFLVFILNLDMIDCISDMLSVISILLGFTITGLSVMIGQDFSKKLNELIDKKSTLQQTQLQTLASYFSISFFIGITTILLLFIYRFLPLGTEQIIIKIIKSIIIGYFSLNFVIIIFLLKVLIKMFKESV